MPKFRKRSSIPRKWITRQPRRKASRTFCNSHGIEKSDKSELRSHSTSKSWINQLKIDLRYRYSSTRRSMSKCCPPKPYLHVARALSSCRISFLFSSLPHNFAFFPFFSSSTTCAFNTLRRIFPLALLGISSTNLTPPLSFL